MSGLIPQTFIDELLARADIVDVINSQLSLKKTGVNYTACCPFHNEKTPSFVVSPAKQIYHCFGCGVGGNAISFLIANDRLDFIEAIELLAAQLGLAVPREVTTSNVNKVANTDLYQLLEQVAKYYQEQLRLTPVAIDYLKQRQLTGIIAKNFGIGYAPSGWHNLTAHFNHKPAILEQLVIAGMIKKKPEGGYYDLFRERIMFPIRDRRNRIIGFGGRILNDGLPKYLNSPETPLFHKSQELYGLYEALQAERALPRVIVVEGYIDVVMLAQHEITNAVATLGTATTIEHIKRLNKLTQEIVFCFDGDQAGKAAAWKALETVLPVIQDDVQVKFLLLPEGEDPDSLVQKETKSGFMQRLEQSQTLSDFLFNQLMTKANLATLDGKAHFARLTSNYLKNVPVGFYRQMLLERLAQLVQIDTAKLESFLTKTIKLVEQGTVSEIKADKPASAMQKAISLILQNPSQAAIAVANCPDIYTLQLPGSELMHELLQELKQIPHATTAILLEHWREKSEFRLLNKLALREFLAPLEGVAIELADTLQHLIFLNNEFLTETLMVKARNNDLTLQEKKLLLRLFNKSKTH